MRQSKEIQILKTRFWPFFANLASLRKIRNFREKVIFTKVDMMASLRKIRNFQEEVIFTKVDMVGINRFGTICQVQ
ncbi:hypothetical protein T4C_570 [Trichinella pseudospiralis]|uniref:Uncharacterized protein n=1 Tax=Trichinella pseudospiralis TaxID=6337 RepID=A0A0V1GUH6_TRIPS|nr:hypothetical protein T4C_570 [Trichinella pseudospiralis]